jgi:hypothetical protein
MARKKNTESEGESEKAKPAEVVAVISAGKLKKLLGAHRAAIRDAAQIASALGSELKDAKKNNHLHLGAFKNIAKLDKMEPEELRNYMDHWEYYYDVSGLKKRAESVMRMNLESKDEDGEEDEEGSTGNVHGFPAAAGRA